MDIEKLEFLPKRSKIPELSADKYHRYRRGYKQKNTKFDISMYKMIRHVLKNHIGQHFNDAFSKTIKLIPFIDKKSFMEFFSRWGYYRITENGLIYFKKEKKKKEVVFYKGGEWIEVYKGTNLSVEKFPYRYLIEKKRRETELIYTGETLVFSSARDPKFQRLLSERLKKEKKETIIFKKAKKEQAYSFISKKEEEVKKQKRLDKQKLYSHGFDDTSFKERRRNYKNIKKDLLELSLNTLQT